MHYDAFTDHAKLAPKVALRFTEATYEGQKAHTPFTNGDTFSLQYSASNGGGKIVIVGSDTFLHLNDGMKWQIRRWEAGDYVTALNTRLIHQDWVVVKQIP